MITKKTKTIVSVLMSLALVLGMGILNVWAESSDVIDPNKPVTLTVNKYLSPEESIILGDGYTAPTAPNLKPGPGVTFTLTKLMNADENTTVDNCIPAVPPMQLTGVTDANGQIKWNSSHGLTQGFYLLEETATPYNGVKSPQNPDGFLAPMCGPSIVTLPFGMQGADNSTVYNYDVIVYPKNVGGINTKTVQELDNVYKPGDIVTWDIKTVISSQIVKEYAIIDKLDSRLNYEGAEVSMMMPGNQFLPLTAGTDYTATLNAATNELVVKLEAAGLDKVKLNRAIAINTIITTKIKLSAFTNEQGELDDAIVNGAFLDFTNDGHYLDDNKVPIPESASVTLSSLDLLKVSKDDLQPLANAEFKIAATEADALAGNFLRNNNGEVVLRTDSNGQAFASGIPYSEVVRGQDGNIESINVYLVETKAPEGYVLPQKTSLLGGVQPVVFKVELEQGQSEVVTDPNTGNTVTYTKFTGSAEITNNKPFNLPLTGGIGTVIFTVGGLALILGAVLLLWKSRKAESK
jgi:fimbrial isopeptide formation D2 family protein/LPXTG-motif cell wall-anchored protein